MARDEAKDDEGTDEGKEASKAEASRRGSGSSSDDDDEDMSAEEREEMEQMTKQVSAVVTSPVQWQEALGFQCSGWWKRAPLNTGLRLATLDDPLERPTRARRQRPTRSAAAERPRRVF
jgi:hypothetical protein